MRQVSLLVWLSFLIFSSFQGVHAETTEESVHESEINLVLTTFQEILRPGDPFTATVALINTGEYDLANFSVQVILPPQAVSLTSAVTPPDSADAAIDPNGIVTWEVEALTPGEMLTLELAGSVAPQVVTLQDVLVVATISQERVEVAREEKTLLPIITVGRRTSTDSSREIETIVTSLELVSNAELVGLTVTETLSTLLDAEQVRPVATKRVDNARASLGRVEWFFPMAEVGQQIELEYRAEYSVELNLGVFEVTTAASVVDDRSELFFSGEDTLEIRTPLFTITGHEAQDETPDDPKRPGDSAAVTFTVENSGAPVDDVTVRAQVEGEVLVIASATAGTVAGSSATWNRPISDAPESFKYTVEIKSDILEDRETDLVASVEIDGILIVRDTVPFLVDTERRQGSNTAQWFTLILLFMVLSVGALLWFARSPGGIKGQTGYIAVVFAILTSILILAFGLEIATEATLTLLGAIAGYVLGQRKWEQNNSGNGDDQEK